MNGIQKNRITPDQALMHMWILEGLPPKVLQQHKKILGIFDSEESIEFDNEIANDEPNNDEKSNLPNEES